MVKLMEAAARHSNPNQVLEPVSERLTGGCWLAFGLGSSVCPPTHMQRSRGASDTCCAADSDAGAPGKPAYSPSLAHLLGQG